MRKFFLSNLLVLAGLIFYFGVGQASAQSLQSTTGEKQAANMLKGSWVLNLLLEPSGMLPVPTTFGKGGKGTFSTPVGVLPHVYRETDTTFSIVLEAPMLLLDGSDTTIVIRGKKTDANNLTGDAYSIGTNPDPNSPFGVQIIFMRINALRNK